MSEHIIELGDVISVLKDYNDNAFDAVLCDPPYGLSFMGKRWDYDVPGAELWREVLRVCKPGAPLIAFSGTRTYHRMVVQIEDAGWEIRDQLAWMYGSGFPKSLDISKAIDKTEGHWRGRAGAVTSDNPAMTGANYERTPKGDPITAAAAWHGYGTALKPAYEPAVLARKPLDGTVAQNVARWGVGALAIDPCRIGYANDADKAKMSEGVEKIRAKGGVMEGSWKNSSDLSGANPASDLGRWPANVLLDEEAGAVLDAQTGNRPSSPYPEHTSPGAVLPLTKRTAGGYSDSGGASRFFKRIECDSASIAKSLSTLPSLLDAFAQSVAAISPYPEGLAKALPSCRELFTDVTQIGSALSGARNTDSILNIGERFLLASKHTSTLLTDLASYAGPSEWIDITRIMESLERCTSCVAPVISACTSQSSEHGAPVSRFRYEAKASKKERDAGCEGLPLRSAAEMTDSEEGQARLDSPRTGAGRTGGARNHHPTVKPVALMEYLARLIMPPGPGAILVPFSGSGSEMIGALRAGWPAVVGIERESEYVEIALARLKGAA